MIDEQPETLIPTTAAAAFLEVKAGHELFGIALQPWSASRVVAANSMGLVWPLPPEAADQLRSNGLYAGSLRDTIILTWLRTILNASEQTKEAFATQHPKASSAELTAFLAAWNVQRATRSPREAFDAAIAWAEEQHLTDLAGAPFAEAYRLTLATLLGVSVSEFEVEAPAGSKAEDGAPAPNV